MMPWEEAAQNQQSPESPMPWEEAARNQAKPPEEAQEGLDLQDVRGGGQAALGGLLAGFADEAVGAVRSLMPDPAYDFGEGVSQEKQSFGDQYRMYRDDARASQKEFREENPVSSFVLEAAGAIASPINKIAPNATGLARTTGRAAAEGALYGLGEGEGSFEDQLKNAATGASFGAGTNLALGSLGRAARAASKRRVKKDLGRGDAQIPLNMADAEGPIGKFYRESVANAFGGRGAIGRMESSAINANPKLARFAGADGFVVPPGEVGTANAIRGVGGRIKDEYTRLRRANNALIDNTKKTDKIAREVFSERGKKGIAIAEREGVRDIMDNALPANAPPEVRESMLNASTIKEGDDILSKWWSDEGFSTVKNKEFIWDQRVLERVRKELKENPELREGVAKKVGGLEELETIIGEGGMGIKGDVMMEIRNQFARKANAPAASLTGKANRTVAEEFDTMFENRLSIEDFSEYSDQLARWGSKQAISKAVRQAKNRLNKKGDPTLQDVTSKFGRGEGSDKGRALAYSAQESSDAAKRKEEGRLSLTRSKIASDLSRAKNKKTRLIDAKQAADQRLARETQGLSKEDSSLWSQAATTAILGAPAAAVFGPLGVLPAGAATARALAAKPVQRTVAGQSRWQEKLAKAMREQDTDEYARILARIAAQQGAN